MRKALALINQKIGLALLIPQVGRNHSRVGSDLGRFTQSNELPKIQHRNPIARTVSSHAERLRFGSLPGNQSDRITLSGGFSILQISASTWVKYSGSSSPIFRMIRFQSIALN